jgi:hypothetical protein
MKINVWQDFAEETFWRNKEKLDALFFCPEAFVKEHFEAMAYLANVLSRKGYKVGFVRCYNLFERCPSFGASGISIDSDKKAFRSICNNCHQTHFLEFKDSDIRQIFLNQYANQLRKRIKEMSAKVLRGIADTKFKQTMLSRLLGLEFVLATKKIQFDASLESDLRFMGNLCQSFVTSYLCAKKIIQIFKPDNILVFNDYVTNLGCLFAGRKLGKKIFVISQAANKNIDRSKILIRNNYSAIYLREHCKKWEKWKRRPLSYYQICQVVEDIRTRFFNHGSHIYSNPITERCPIILEKAKKAKCTICFYSSSLDEIIAEKNQFEALSGKKAKFDSMFNCEIEELQRNILNLIREAAIHRKETLFIIRIHPREGITKRESFSSQHLKMLQADLSNMPANVHVVLPEVKVSSYFLAEISDHVLTAWSTIGYELGRLGIPVSTFTSGLSGFPDVGSVCYLNNKKKFYQRIDKVRQKSIKINTVTELFRLWYFKMLSGAVDCTQDYAAGRFIVEGGNKLKTVQKIEKCIIEDSEVSDLNLEEQKYVKNKKEKLIIKSKLLSLCSEIINCNITKMTKNSSSIFGSKSNNISYKEKKIILSRFSPMIKRILSLT